VTWAGVEWTMVMWPPPQYKSPRMRLMLHECFHRVQKKVGLPPADSMNGHLDSLDGRIWLQMEWRALEHAFWQRGDERRRDIAMPCTSGIFAARFSLKPRLVKPHWRCMKAWPNTPA